jgi:hypothetical protein
MRKMERDEMSQSTTLITHCGHEVGDVEVGLVLMSQYPIPRPHIDLPGSGRGGQELARSSIWGKHLEVQSCFHMLGHPRFTTWLASMASEKGKKKREGAGPKARIYTHPGLVCARLHFSTLQACSEAVDSVLSPSPCG